MFGRRDETWGVTDLRVRTGAEPCCKSGPPLALRPRLIKLVVPGLCERLAGPWLNWPAAVLVGPTRPGVLTGEGLREIESTIAGIPEGSLNAA